MKTLYLKDGTEIQRDEVDAKDYVRAGLATYEKPVLEVVAEIVEEEEKEKRGRKPNPK